MFEWSPLAAFHFSVIMVAEGDWKKNILNAQLPIQEVAFQEVSGLESSLETEEVRCGGDYSTVYHLPKKVKYSDLVLKRAVVSKEDPFYIWCKKNLSAEANFDFLLKCLFINLCDCDGHIVRSWAVEGAYPYKWSLGNLDAMKNELAIESVSLKHRSLFCLL